jgi:hypothetical protein
LGGWRRDRGLMSTPHRCRGSVKREDGTATAFLRAQPSSLPHHPHLSLSPPSRSPPCFPLLARGRGRASGAAGKTPSSLQLTPCPESHNADIPKKLGKNYETNLSPQRHRGTQK